MALRYADTTPDRAKIALLDDECFDWEMTLRARNASENTLATYLTSVRLFVEFLIAAGGPDDVANITREHVERFQAHLVDLGRKPATVHNRYRALKSFFSWLADRGDDGAALIARSPMERMKPPILPEPHTPLLTPEQIERLLRSCQRDKSFEGVRDRALIMFMLNTGARRAEVAGMKFSEDENDPENSIIDWRRGLVRLYGKGRRERIIHIDDEVIVSLRRYIRLRKRHHSSRSGSLWLGLRGPLLGNGIMQLIKRRGRQAGILSIHPHQLRHTFSHEFLVAGGRESDLMALNGWRSSAMVRRYAATAQQERAIEAHRQMNLSSRRLSA